MFGKKNFEKKDVATTNKEIEKKPIEEKTTEKIKKIKKAKEIWDNSTYKIKNIGFPEEIDSKWKSNKKYKIHLDYYDGNKKLHRKTIRFGKKTDSDYIDHKDRTKKNKLSAKLGNTHNLFHGNYWRWHILNGDGDLKKNWMELINDL